MQNIDEECENLRRKCKEIEQLQEELLIEKQKIYYKFNDEQNKISYFQNNFTSESINKLRNQLIQGQENINNQVQKLYYEYETQKEEIQNQMKKIRR